MGLAPDALAPRLTAYTVVGGLRELYMTHEAHRRDTATEELLPLVDHVLDFARAGLAELRRIPAGSAQLLSHTVRAVREVRRPEPPG